MGNMVLPRALFKETAAYNFISYYIGGYRLAGCRVRQAAESRYSISTHKKIDLQVGFFVLIFFSGLVLGGTRNMWDESKLLDKKK